MPSPSPPLLEAIDALGIWSAGGERAPHKPLLLLLALGRLQRGGPRLIAFEAIEGPMKKLLEAYGPSRRPHHPEYPFWYLQTDRLWEIPGVATLHRKKSSRKSVPLLSALRPARGGFPEAIYAQLQAEPALVRRLAQKLLADHFPASYHADLLAAVGLNLETPTLSSQRPARPRDPRFRRTVCNAYGYRCAVCGLDPTLDGTSVGLEAAHVFWHSHGGPSTLDNGLCLCPLHHKAFDLGAIGVSVEHRVVVSSRLHGGEAVERFLGDYNGQALQGPLHGQDRVHATYLNWHQEQVFKSPPRPEPA